MAELPERRTDQLPTRPLAPAPLFGHAPAFGVAHDLDLMKQGALPPRTPRPQSRRHQAAVAAYGQPRGRRMRTWWASRDRGPGDLWHRVLCRFGRHEMRGGHQLQLGSRFVFVERRCQWCGATPTT